MDTPAFIERSPLGRVLWAFRREFLVVGVFSAVANVLMLVPTLYMLQVYDRALISQSRLTLLALSAIALFLLGLMATSEWARSRLLVRAGTHLDGQMGTRVFDASFRASLSQAANSSPRAFDDLLVVRQFVTGQGIFAVFDAPWVPIYVAVTFLLHPVLGVLALVFALGQVALGWFGHRTTLAPFEAASRSGAEVDAYLHSKLRNAEVAEAMGMVENLRRRWRAAQDAHLADSARAQGLRNRVTALSKFVRHGQQCLALAAGGLLAIRGELTPAAMVAATLLIGRALAPIDQAVSLWRGIVSARCAFGRIDRLLQAYPQRQPAAGALPARGQLTLRNVVAMANGRDAPILDGISLRIEPGTITAVVGASGSGKSTLARTLMGIWPQVEGDVLVDGLPLAGRDRAEAGPLLGYLPQDVQLFDGTIAENIARMGAVDPARVIAAARATGLHEAILRHPDGYDTPIGEAGRLLSGGLRQRIGLARALHGEPLLQVLDEPEANLDEAGEQALRRTLVRLRAKGRTVVIMSHPRPGVLDIADRVLVLHEGRIVADGAPAAVLTALRPGRAAAPRAVASAARSVRPA